MMAIKDDWLKKFKTLDTADKSSPSKRKPSVSVDDREKKKQKTDGLDEEFLSFTKGNDLTKTQYLRVGKTLQAKLKLKKPPSNVRPAPDTRGFSLTVIRISSLRCHCSLESSPLSQHLLSSTNGTSS